MCVCEREKERKKEKSEDFYFTDDATRHFTGKRHDQSIAGGRKALSELKHKVTDLVRRRSTRAAQRGPLHGVADNF